MDQTPMAMAGMSGMPAMGNYMSPQQQNMMMQNANALQQSQPDYNPSAGIQAQVLNSILNAPSSKSSVSPPAQLASAAPAGTTSVPPPDSSAGSIFSGLFGGVY